MRIKEAIIETGLNTTTVPTLYVVGTVQILFFSVNLRKV